MISVLCSFEGRELIQFGICFSLSLAVARYADSEAAYNKISPERMDAPVHWPNTMQIATGEQSTHTSLTG